MSDERHTDRDEEVIGGADEDHNPVEAARDREAQEREQERAEDGAPTEAEPVPEGEGPI